MNKCFRCGELKEDNEFYQYAYRTFSYCKVCARAKYKVDDTERRRHNFRGMWLKRYQMMTQRVETGGWGPYKSNAKGKELLAKQEFLDWCERPENLKKWKRLHKAYVASGYDADKVVSIDRVDNDGGYTVGNMQWLTVKANAEKGTK